MEAPATHIIVGVETALGLLFTLGTAAVTTIEDGDVRTSTVCA